MLAARDLGVENILPITFDYGQLAAGPEIEAARALAREAGVAEPVMVRLEFPTETPLTGGASAGEVASVADDRGVVASSFVPGRNLVMLAHAFGLAFDAGACSVYFGACADDAAGYPDCGPGFIDAAEKAGNLAMGGSAIRVIAPLVRMSKREVVRLGEELGVPWELTFSCYTPVSDRHCGSCESCLQRRSAFEAAGLEEGPW
jgi:7-cyano-7-deazaguanine synthase